MGRVCGGLHANLVPRHRVIDIVEETIDAGPHGPNAVMAGPLCSNADLNQDAWQQAVLSSDSMRGGVPISATLESAADSTHRAAPTLGPICLRFLLLPRSHRCLALTNPLQVCPHVCAPFAVCAMALAYSTVSQSQGGLGLSAAEALANGRACRNASKTYCLSKWKEKYPGDPDGDKACRGIAGLAPPPPPPPPPSAPTQCSSSSAHWLSDYEYCHGLSNPKQYPQADAGNCCYTCRSNSNPSKRSNPCPETAPYFTGLWQFTTVGACGWGYMLQCSPVSSQHCTIGGGSGFGCKDGKAVEGWNPDD